MKIKKGETAFTYMGKRISLFLSCVPAVANAIRIKKKNAHKTRQKPKKGTFFFLQPQRGWEKKTEGKKEKGEEVDATLLDR
jgi:hypothetical protein